MPATPSDRRQASQIANLTRWSREANPRAATAPARAAFDSKWEREVDPEGVLDPEERAKRAERAKKAHMRRLALRSAKARRERGAA